MHSHLVWFFCCFWSFLGFSQDLEQLIELHAENMKNLSTSRSVNWTHSGKVTKSDLQDMLEDYNGNGYYLSVGVAIYTFHDDTLNFHLLTNYGLEIDTNHSIKKDSLISLIQFANTGFPEGAENRTPQLRGANSENTRATGISFEEAFERVNKLLLPEINEIRNLEHLIIVPVLNISTLPFAAFKLDEETYLIDEMSYSIAPSIFEIMVDYKKLTNSNYSMFDSMGRLRMLFENPLFISNPTFSEKGDYVLPDLPGTTMEVDSILANLETSEYTRFEGQRATKANVLNDINERDLLYFATHGISDSEDPLNNSFLALAEDNANSSLTTREIQDLRFTCKLKADLVVLSACQTGLGKTHEGGIIGIGRAFQIAGAKHVVTSLWNISDSETAKLMSLFFKRLQEYQVLTPHEALRQAILEYKKNINPDPRYWAAFSIIGIPYHPF
jgi:CHAT domain-containing protein